MSDVSVPVASAQQLRVALEQTAAALAEARLDDLLAAGEALEVALAQIPRARSSSPADADRMRAEIDAARAALLRCRRLGVSLGDFVRATFDAHGEATEYDPSRQAAMALTGRNLNTSL
ncbi:MAG: hypothetical protein ABL986_12260 [Vicinamibacterales bacterium]